MERLIQNLGAMAGCAPNVAPPTYHEGHVGRSFSGGQETAPRMPGLGEAYSALTAALNDLEEITAALEKRLEPVSRPVPRGTESGGATPMPAVSPLAQAFIVVASRMRMATIRLREVELNLDV